jgi:hypothetical protein
MNPDELDRIRARAAAASPGQWRRHGADIWVDGQSEPLFRGRDGSGEVRRQADADADFVVAALDDLLMMLRHLDELGATAAPTIGIDPVRDDAETSRSDPDGDTATGSAPIVR